ncbi:hypothetical protein [Maribacter sp. 2307ULW6-5]|uniref:hypothetical protein n=1 Tax=Maribacter sp. 2307ULW6-5 TaxID=3386275 RepID=UPI0039BD3285
MMFFSIAFGITPKPKANLPKVAKAKISRYLLSLKTYFKNYGFPQIKSPLEEKDSKTPPVNIAVEIFPVLHTIIPAMDTGCSLYEREKKGFDFVYGLL